MTTHTKGQYENEHINYGLHLHPPKPKNYKKIVPRRGRIETDIPFLVTAYFHLYTYIFFQRQKIFISLFFSLLNLTGVLYLWTIRENLV